LGYGTTMRLRLPAVETGVTPAEKEDHGIAT
jgi:hypothetical protein